MSENSTHLMFDGSKIVISPDMVPVFNFLSEIEKEVEYMVNFSNKLEQVREGYLELLEFGKFLGQKLADNSISFEYRLKNNLEGIIKDFEPYFPARAEMIVLFASLEVLFFLHLAYEHKTDDDRMLRELAMNDKSIKSFLNNYLLTDENEYYLANKSRFIKFNAGQLRALRNSLTHFFSVASGGLSVIPSSLEEKARKFENIMVNNKHGNVVFISPKDLQSLIRSANLLRLRRWTDEFLSNSIGFNEKMRYVINIVKTNGAVVVHDREVNIKP